MTDRQVERLKSRFLESFARVGNVTAAAEACGVRRTGVYEWLERDEVFTAAYRLAELQATEVLEREAWRRACEGTEEPVHYLGERVDTVRKYSDVLLIFLLKGRKPDMYRERVDVNQNVTQVVKAYAGFNPAEV